MVWNIMHGVDLETAKATSLEKRVRHSKNSDARFCFLPFSLRRRWELIALPSPYSWKESRQCYLGGTQNTRIPLYLLFFGPGSLPRVVRAAGRPICSWRVGQKFSFSFLASESRLQVEGFSAESMRMVEEQGSPRIIKTHLALEMLPHQVPDITQFYCNYCRCLRSMQRWSTWQGIQEM